MISSFQLGFEWTPFTISLDFLSLVGYAVLANKLIVWIRANPKVINTISACVLIIIAIIIAITQQY